MDNISLDQIDAKIQLIMRQTDYSKEKAREKLIEFKYDEIVVIKDYFGISEKKPKKIESLNQEIYKHLRGHLDTAMKGYQERVEKGDAKKIS